MEKRNFLSHKESVRQKHVRHVPHEARRNQLLNSHDQTQLAALFRLTTRIHYVIAEQGSRNVLGTRRHSIARGSGRCSEPCERVHSPLWRKRTPGLSRGNRRWSVARAYTRRTDAALTVPPSLSDSSHAAFAPSLSHPGTEEGARERERARTRRVRELVLRERGGNRGSQVKSAVSCWKRDDLRTPRESYGTSWRTARPWRGASET